MLIKETTLNKVGEIVIKQPYAITIAAFVMIAKNVLQATQTENNDHEKNSNDTRIHNNSTKAHSLSNRGNTISCKTITAITGPSKSSNDAQSIETKDAMCGLIFTLPFAGICLKTSREITTDATN